MTALQHALCQDTRQSIRELLTVIVKVSGFTNLAPCLHPQLRMEVARLKLLDSKLLGTSNLLCVQEAEMSPNTLQLLVSCISENAALQMALVPQLQRFGKRLSIPTAGSLGTVEEDMFWELWASLMGSCVVNMIVTKTQPTAFLNLQQALCNQVHLATQSVLTWILSISRSPVWCAMKVGNGLRHRNLEVSSILFQATSFLALIGEAPTPVALRLACWVPDQLLPLICCIASEQLCPVRTTQQHDQSGTRHPATTYVLGSTSRLVFPPSLYQSLCLLASTINNLECLASRAGRAGVCTFVTAPAVLLLLKLFITLPPEVHPAVKDYRRMAAGCLPRLLHRSQAQHVASLTASTTQDGERARIGLPMRQHPLLCADALETDVQLLHVLTDCMQRGALPKWEGLRAQAMVLDSWKNARACPFTTAAATQAMAASNIGLAKECTGHALQEMQQLQRSVNLIELGQRPAVTTKPGTQQQWENQLVQMSGPASVVVGEPDAYDLKAATGERLLMAQVSWFCMTQIDYTYASQIGECHLRGQPRTQVLHHVLLFVCEVARMSQSESGMTNFL